MNPQIHVNWFAVAGAVVAAFAFGGVWYGPLWGKTWGGLMGMDMSKPPAPAVMKRAFANQLVGTFLTAYVMTFSLKVWMPSVWGLGPDMGPYYMYGLYAGFFTWLGFYVPLQLSKVSWEGRPWKLFFINAGHDFINLQIIAQILAHWR
jgi:hypothetical protein